MYYNPITCTRESIRMEDLDSCLQWSTVAEIKELITRLSLPVKKTGRKIELVERVTDFLTRYPNYLVGRLSLDELEIARKVLAGECVVGDYAVLSTYNVLIKLGWLQMRGVAKDSSAMELIFLEKAENLLADLIKNQPTTRFHEIHRIVSRWSMLCGILPMDCMVRHLNTLPGMENVTEADIARAIDLFEGDKRLYWENNFNNGEGDAIYVTAWAEITGGINRMFTKWAIVDGCERTVNAYDPVMFSYQDIMATGLPLFAPVTPNRAATNKLQRVLRELGLTVREVDEILCDFWRCKQQGMERASEMLCFDKINFTRPGQVGRVLQAVTEYLNTLPFWNFLGSTSEKEFEKRPVDPSRPPRLSAGPGMRAMGLDITPEQQAEFERMIRAVKAQEREAASWKVGRNDPCPCGSGKKFKNCCGR